MCCFRVGTSCGWKKNLSHTHKVGYWYLSRFFQNFRLEPSCFLYGSSPPPVENSLPTEEKEERQEPKLKRSLNRLILDFVLWYVTDPVLGRREAYLGLDMLAVHDGPLKFSILNERVPSVNWRRFSQWDKARPRFRRLCVFDFWFRGCPICR